MENITIDLTLLRKLNLSINEYLSLYNLVCPGCIDTIFIPRSSDIVRLEKKGYVKITPDEVILRELAKDLFGVKDDYFLQWLTTYPIRVKKSTGGSRALSPRSDDTIEGKKLRKKWNTMFRGKPLEEKRAIKVLEAELEMRRKANSLEFMVESARWLNGGYHEKYEYLLEEDTNVDANGLVISHEEDWE